MIITIIGYWALSNYVALQLITIIGVKSLDKDLSLRITISSGFALLIAAVALK